MAAWSACPDGSTGMVGPLPSTSEIANKSRMIPPAIWKVSSDNPIASYPKSATLSHPFTIADVARPRRCRRSILLRSGARGQDAGRNDRDEPGIEQSCDDGRATPGEDHPRDHPIGPRLWWIGIAPDGGGDRRGRN